jgi:diguanylate cyclase (GGDEF)-like protein/PAS domain S-box-containing protein
VSSTRLAAAAESSPPPTIGLLEGLPDAILLLDRGGAIAYANAAAARLYGQTPAQLTGRIFPTLLAEPFAKEYTEMLGRLGAGETVSILDERREVVGHQPDGSSMPIELILSEVTVGQTSSLAAVAHDIRARKLAEARLRLMADQDSLTELVNRIGFERAITEHVVHAARYGNGGSVIALGIDNFNYVNETLGLEAGDELLVGVADLIEGRLRKTDILGRVGGDVFGVLAHGTDMTKAISLADELLDVARGHRFVLKGESIRISLSAGVTSLDDRSVIGSELFAEAEAAMHEAKESGRDRVLGHDPDGRTELGAQRAWSERVRHALEKGLFVLTSQPIMDLGRNEITQHEILIRMRDDGGGLIEPAAFLATAERFGLIGGIDRWVTQQAMRLIAAHNREGRELVLEVNLSGKTMGDAKFPDEVRRELISSGIDPASLIFEVTETAAVADIKTARLFAQSLAKIGCRVALDDFGAGYASFYYLKHLPISFLKIDGEFVRELPDSPTDQLIVKALVEVCEGLGIKTIAEFVTDQLVMDMVRDLGVDFAQGYQLGKPAPVSALRAG